MLFEKCTLLNSLFGFLFCRLIVFLELYMYLCQRVFLCYDTQFDALLGRTYCNPSIPAQIVCVTILLIILFGVIVRLVVVSNDLFYYKLLIYK